MLSQLDSFHCVELDLTLELHLPQLSKGGEKTSNF